MGLQKIRVIRVIRGKNPIHNSQLTHSPSPSVPHSQLTNSQLPNPLPSSLRQAQDDNNGITCFLELYKLTTHPLTTHNLSR